jgi:hypothetical protein
VNAFDLLLADLQSNQLVTILAPSKRSDRREWDQIRVNLSENPRWYRKLCAEHPSSRGYHRGFDTRIKRRNVTRLLEKLAAGSPVKSKYADELRRIAEKKFGEIESRC